MKKFVIIPELVSLETNTQSLKDFLLSQDLSFYPFSKPLKKHYHVVFTNKISIPNTHIARFGNYIVTKDSIYYQRRIYKNIGFLFSYNFKTKSFFFNSVYKYHFVNIGDIFTLGRHLFHVIESDLAKEGYYLVLGACVRKGNNSIILLAPNGNGKTDFVNKALKKGYEYIAENYLILHPKTKQVFGIAPIFQNKGSFANRELGEIFNNNSIAVVEKEKVKKIYLLSQHTRDADKTTIVANYMDTYSQYYKKNNLVRSLSYLNLENTHLDKQYNALKTFLSENTKVISNISLILV